MNKRSKQVASSTQIESAINFHVGLDAEKQLQRFLQRAFEEDATGGVFGYRWQVDCQAEPGMSVAPALTRLTDFDLILKDILMFNLIIVDSGNADGDSWKYVYHVGHKVGTFTQES